MIYLFLKGADWSDAMLVRRKDDGRRSWVVYLLILAVVIAPVRLAGAISAPGVDNSVQSASAVTSHCKTTSSMQMQERQSVGTASAHEDCDCCDSICSCVNCSQDCYQIHIVSLIGLINHDSGYQPPVLHAHMETTIHGITFPPFEPPPIRQFPQS